jgi:hypothetical protein
MIAKPISIKDAERTVEKRSTLSREIYGMSRILRVKQFTLTLP